MLNLPARAFPELPRLYTPRLCLRPFVMADAERVVELAGDRRIAATTGRVPHPYTKAAAEEFIESRQARVESCQAHVVDGHGGEQDDGAEFTFAITLAGTRSPGREHDVAETGHLIGSIGLRVEGAADNRRAELGYWIGVPYWGKGFATEAGRAVLEFAFSRKGLHRVTAGHFACNAASGRVMQKLGMTCEGTLRSHHYKWGEFHDVVRYGILATEWSRLKKSRKLPAAREALQAV